MQESMHWFPMYYPQSGEYMTQIITCNYSNENEATNLCQQTPQSDIDTYNFVMIKVDVPIISFKHQTIQRSNIPTEIPGRQKKKSHQIHGNIYTKKVAQTLITCGTYRLYFTAMPIVQLESIGTVLAFRLRFCFHFYVYFLIYQMSRQQNV